MGESGEWLNSHSTTLGQTCDCTKFQIHLLLKIIEYQHCSYFIAATHEINKEGNLLMCIYALHL